MRARSSRQLHRDFRKTGYREASKAFSAGAAPTSSGDGQPVAKKPDRAARKKYLREYVHWLWPYRWAITGVFVLAVIATALDLIWPLAIKGVIDLLPKELPVAEKVHTLKLLGAAIIAVLILKQAADALR